MTFFELFLRVDKAFAEEVFIPRHCYNPSMRVLSYLSFFTKYN